MKTLVVVLLAALAIPAFAKESMAPIARLSSAMDQANWVENTQKVPKKWWKKEGQVWISKDGKVTFAVGKGQSQMIQLAQDKAELEARLLLATGGKPHGNINVTLYWTVPIAYRTNDKKGICLVLMAVPTELLPGK